jgi:N-acetylglutamate synthase-like GNAT family acetyltransferase
MPVSVRRLGPGDEDVLRLLAEEAPDFDLPGREPQPPLEPTAAATYLTSTWVLHWVAEEDGRVLGDLVCHVLPLPHRGTELLLYSIGVREAHRRRGVGRALVDQMFRWSRANQIDEIWVLADNPDAEAFYAACGFRRGEADEQGLLMLTSCNI